METIFSSTEIIIEQEASAISNPNELQNIYTALSIHEEASNFELNDQYEKVKMFIELIYEKQFLLMPSESLQCNEELLNSSFVELYNYCIDKRFKKAGIIFIVYADYFNLDVNKFYIALHLKLQNIIKNDLKKTIGNEIFKKYEKKVALNNTINNGGIKVKTLFDLVKEKQNKLNK